MTEQSVPIRGVFPVIATPFHEDGSVDGESLQRVVGHVLRSGAHGAVYPAVASEFDTLSEHERRKLTEVVVEEVGGRIPIIVGITAAESRVSIKLAKHARSLKVGHVMLMAPRELNGNLAGVKQFYKAVADECELPIVLQNAPAPTGLALEVRTILDLITQVPLIQYVKEETLPCGQRITQLLDAAPPTLRGVFGGAGGRFLIDELNRGAIGSMPSCELAEIHVAIYESYLRGEQQHARQLFNRLLPLLNFQSVFRMAMTKEVLYRHGLVTSTHVRASNPSLDSGDIQELATLLSDITDLLRPGTH